MNKPFQREGSESNAHVGRQFEQKALTFFNSIGFDLQPSISLNIGVNGTKQHYFDLGNIKTKIIVECKSHKWTKGKDRENRENRKNTPSAKMSVWNEVMYLFYLAPNDFRKILFVLKDIHPDRLETLAQYYIRTYSHLIPENVEIWEYNEDTGKAAQVK